MMNGMNYSSLQPRNSLIHIVDDEIAVCEALSVLFRLEGYQTEFFTSGEVFLDALRTRQADCLILDQQLPGLTGVDVLSRLREMRVVMPVFMISGHSDVRNAIKAMKLGATDYFEKPFDTEALVKSVGEALSKNVHIGGEAIGRRPIEIRGFSQLTPREREVLQLITNGASNKEAGRELGISPRTIEVHRARIMEKLGAKNTADLVRIVLTS